MKHLFRGFPAQGISPDHGPVNAINLQSVACQVCLLPTHFSWILVSPDIPLEKEDPCGVQIYFVKRTDLRKIS